jgi:hypothetical protein
MNRKQRTLWKDGATLKDVSASLADFRKGDVVFDVQPGEHLYVGTDLPFNHRFFDVKTANDVASVVTVELWDGSDWKGTVDLVDGTRDEATGLISLAQSGLITFAPDRELATWGRVSDSKDVTGLETTRIYDLFWTRFSWSIAVKGTTALRFIGMRFCSDDELASFYPDTANASLKSAFAAGKTDWREQCLAAADCIVADLRKQSVVVRGEQILDPTLFLMAAVHKTASLIYQGIVNFRDRVKDCETQYREAMSMQFFEVDRNADAIRDDGEVTQSTRFLHR